MPDSLDDPKVAVALARVEGSIVQLTETVALRITHVEHDLRRVDAKATAAHTRADATHDKLRDELSAKIADLQHSIEEMDGSIRNLELWKQKIVGAVVAVSALGGSAASIVWWAFSRVAEGG
jgi:hypothetical protein